MTTNLLDFSEVPRTVSVIQKLLTTSLHEVANIVNVINDGGEDRLVALNKNIFQGAKIALLPYKELLTKDYRFRQDDSIDKLFVAFTDTWSQLAQEVLKALPAEKKARQFSVAWRKANDELSDILKRKKSRDEKSDRVYEDFVAALDKVAVLMKDDVRAQANSQRAAMSRKIDNLSRNQMKDRQFLRSIDKRLGDDEAATDHDNEGEFKPDFKGKVDEELLRGAWKVVHSDSMKGKRQSECYNIYKKKHPKATTKDKAFKSFYNAITYQLRRETKHSQS
jgi:hypothetical protein